jgi:hypothetical protein
VRQFDETHWVFRLNIRPLTGGHSNVTKSRKLQSASAVANHPADAEAEPATSQQQGNQMDAEFDADLAAAISK